MIGIFIWLAMLLLEEKQINNLLRFSVAYRYRIPQHPNRQTQMTAQAKLRNQLNHGEASLLDIILKS